MIRLDPDVFYNLEELGELLGVLPYTLRKWVQQGRVPGTKVGRRYLVHGKAMIQKLKDGTHDKVKYSKKHSDK